MKFHPIIAISCTILFISCEKMSLVKALETELSIAMKSVPSLQKTATLQAYDCMASDEEYKNEVVFIAGFDEGDGTYYTKATQYFETQHIEVVQGVHSLSEIVQWLNNKNTYYTSIHIVSHSNAWSGMSLQTTPVGLRINTQSLQEALQNKQIPSLKKGVLEKTTIVFHSCGLGENKPLLQQLEKAFTNDVTPVIVASPYFNVYDGKYASHFLAKPYYIYYPTAHSPGPLALAQQAKNSYPEVDIDWRQALSTREETSIGTPYSYRFNVPVEWNITFTTAEEIPVLNTKEEILDFVISQEEIALALIQMNIPLEAYRWKVKTNNTTLTIQGKSTVLTVLQPVMDAVDKGMYQNPTIKNTKLYTSL